MRSWVGRPRDVSGCQFGSVALLPTSIASILARKRRLDLVIGHLVVLGSGIAVGLSHICHGLIHSPTLWVVVVIPVAAGLLLGPIAMLVRTLVSAIIITLT